MNILIVIGSMRKGNSFTVATEINNALKAHCKNNNIKVTLDILNLAKQKMKFCTGCLECDKTGACVIRDDISKLISKIANYDAFIFISPVRWSLVSGELKTFLDRLNPYATSHKLARKKCITVVIGQSEDGKEEAISVHQASDSLRYFCENAEMELVEQVRIFGCLNAGDIIGNPGIEKSITAATALIH